MEFRTVLTPGKHEGYISHRSPVLMMGSCFSDNIGARMKRDLFNVVINPTGTLYNPESIAVAIERIADGTPFTADDLFEHEGKWHSPAHHSRFSASDPAKAIERMNRELANARQLLPSFSTAIITLGSTRVFRDKSTGATVANCHKLPAARFDEVDLCVAETARCLKRIIDALRHHNAEIKIIFTISPIRHMAYGLEGNSLGKAKLRVAVDEALRDTAGAIYFPSYEIMLDDLRDYRFYCADMKHPSDVAVDYIYSRFLESTTSGDTLSLARECRRLTARLAHLGDGTEASKKFFAETMALIDDLTKIYPYLHSAISQLSEDTTL